MQDLAGLSWTWIVVAGTIVLAVVLAYAMIRNTRTTGRQNAAAEKGARVAYAEEDRNLGGRNSPRTRLGSGPVIITIAIIAVVVLAFLAFALWESGPAVTENEQGADETPDVVAPGNVVPPPGE